MSEPIQIRPMAEADIEAVYAVGKQTTEFAVMSGPPSFWERAQLLGWLFSPDDVLLIAETEGKLAGFVLSQLHRPTGKATIENLVVLPEYRRYGVATELLGTCLAALRIRHATYVCALTHTTNAPMIKFLTKHGFQRGHDFVWMAKEE